MNDKIHIIGPRRNWVLSLALVKGLVVLGSGLLGLLIVTVIGLFIYYQYLQPLPVATFPDPSPEIQRLEAALTQFQQTHAQEIAQLKQTLAEKEKQLSEATLALAPTNTAPEVHKLQVLLQEKTVQADKLQQQYLEVQKQSQDIQKQLMETQKQFMEAQKQISNLTQYVDELKKAMLAPPQPTSQVSLPLPNQTLAATTEAQVQPDPAGQSLVALEQFQIRKSETQILVDFSLKNLRESQQRSGYLRVLALTQEQLTQPVTFNRRESISVVFRRLRPIARDFSINPEVPFVAIRILFWDSQKRLLVDQTFPLETP